MPESCRSGPDPIDVWASAGRGPRSWPISVIRATIVDSRTGGHAMHYMLLIYIDPTAEVPPAPDGPEQFTDWVACSKALHDAGALVAGDGLAGVEAATSVRRRGGRRLVTDGPFAETKEHLLGFYVVDVDGLDTALDWAARLPSAHYGTVEVRPVAMSSAGADSVA